MSPGRTGAIEHSPCTRPPTAAEAQWHPRRAAPGAVRDLCYLGLMSLTFPWSCLDVGQDSTNFLCACVWIQTLETRGRSTSLVVEGQVNNGVYWVGVPWTPCQPLAVPPAGLQTILMYSWLSLGILGAHPSVPPTPLVFHSEALTRVCYRLGDR